MKKKLNIINIISTYASTAAMQAGKAYKKITTEKLPEDGMIGQDMCLQILQQTVDSKTSKYKEQAAELIAKIKEGDIEPSWTEPKAAKPKVDNTGIFKVLAEIKEVAEAEGYEEILSMLEGVI